MRPAMVFPCGIESESAQRNLRIPIIQGTCWVDSNRLDEYKHLFGKLVYAREIVKAKDPDAKTVFIGPCVAKRSEARRKDVDYVLSFEELGAILAGRKIDVIACEPWPVERPANPTARNYAKSCGVTDAVLTEATSKIPGFKLDAKQINGIDRKTCAMVKLYAAGKMLVNFLEVMACPGGCQNGPCSLA